jgi:hypothetical protein
MDIVHGYTAWT